MRTYEISNFVVPQLKSKLASQGFKIYELDTVGVQDQLSFFKVALAGLPMGDASNHPEVSWSFPQNWNAFTDFLWQGLSEQDAPSAILWMGSFELQNVNEKLYHEAVVAITTADEDTLEIKPAGVSATQLATGAFDQVTIMGGAGTPAYVASAPANTQMFTAGQSFAANTSYAVRMMIPSDAGYVAGRVVAADQDTSAHDLFWVIGIAFSAAGVAAGALIPVESLGSYTLGSSDAAFSSGDVGKPVWLTSAGAFSTTAPSTSGYANFKIGVVETVSSMFINGQMMGVA